MHWIAWIRFRRRGRVLLAALFATGLLGATEAWTQTFDHSAFDRLLRAHVDGEGRVDYDAFARSRAFDSYLDALDRADPESLPPPERLALWINAYNAYTIALINRHEERRSIRNINRALGLIPGKGPWSEPIARVGGRVHTLDEVEHEIIRKRFREPRIHFALVCAALGCPALRREAYAGARLDAQLEDQANAFLLRSPAKNRVDAADGVVYLSPIFQWYGEDFGASDRELLRYLTGFFPAGPQRERLLRGDLRIVYTDYDWALNALDHDAGSR